MHSPTPTYGTLPWKVDDLPTIPRRKLGLPSINIVKNRSLTHQDKPAIAPS